MAEYTPTFDFQADVEKCELCQEKDAQFHCTVCRKEMCNCCKTEHLRNKASCDHNVVRGSIGKSIGNARELIKCTTHPTEIIRMYCTSCDEAVCVKCIDGIIHKNHNFEKPETVLYRYNEEISQNLIETKQQIEQLQKSLHTIDVNAKDYTEVSDKTIIGINNQRNQIKSNIDKLADDLVDQVQKRKEYDLQIMENEKKNIQKIISDHNKHLQSCEEKLKSVKGFTYIRHKIKTSNSILSSITSIKPPTFVSETTLNLQFIFGKLVNTLESKSTQKISIQEEIPNTKTESGVNLDRSPVATISTDAVSKVIPGVISECVSAVSDKEAWCGGGKDLILMDIHGLVKRKIELNNNLYDVVTTPQGDLFVTESGGTSIIKYSPDGKCTKVANTEPYITNGLCYTPEQNNLLVCLYNNDGDSKVVRMTTAGHIKQTIQKNTLHQSLYKDPRYVAENINEDVVVVDALFSPTIVVVNKRGEYRYTYPDSSKSSHRIDWCYGIVCDNTGCILVSDWGNHRIHQIDIDGKFIQFVVTQQHGVHHPYDLSVDNRGQFWLCNDEGEKIVIFKYRSS